MHFEDRFYSGKNHRPKPDVYKTIDGRRVMIVTFWGESTVRQNVQSKLDELLLVDYKNLKSELTLLNTWILEEINKENYLCQLEILVITQLGDLFHWIQIGQPSILVVDKSEGIIPLSLYTSFEIKNKAPLIFEGLGSENVLHTREGYSQQKYFILYQGYGITASFWSCKDYNLNYMTEILSEQSKESSFWIALLQF